LFYLSKLLSALTQPLAWAALLLLLALWWLRRRPIAARRALLGGLAIVALVGWRPPPDALLRRLEDSSKPPGGSLNSFVGMVVLGGAIDPPHNRPGRDQVSLNGAAERMTVPVALMRQYPHLRLLFAGGDSGLWRGGTSPASSAKLLFESLGVDPSRVVYQGASRTTYEDAVTSSAVPGVDKTQRWLLVTSAWHMPRSLATFKAAGWNVTPYPVDYLTGSYTPLTEYSLVEGAFRWQTALHEYLGRLAYAASGRAVQ
jgi:uncharacterized SAM-binding protein YcdF (DUF218 family)